MAATASTVDISDKPAEPLNQTAKIQSIVNLKASNQEIVAPVAQSNTSSNSKLNKSAGVDKSNLNTPPKAIERNIITEDLEYNLAAIKKLTEICLDLEQPILIKIPVKFRAKLLESIPLEVPIKVAAALIDDDGSPEIGSISGSVYWKRLCLDRFPRSKCDPSHHNNSWKSNYFELHLEEIFENVSDQAFVIEQCRIAAPFVSKLNIGQLFPSTWVVAKVSTTTSRSLFSKTLVKDGKAIVIPETVTKEISIPEVSLAENFSVPLQPRLDHFNLESGLKELTKLTSIHLRYSLRECGMNYHQKYFGMTLRDAQNFASAIRSTPSLTHLYIHSSKMDDELCIALCNGIKESPIELLDFSHNHIQDEGTKMIATLLAPYGSSKKQYMPKLTHLNLRNNRITANGIQLLGKALSENNILTDLDLSLNTAIGDLGFELFIQLISTTNTRLTRLSVSGCQVGLESCKAVDVALRHWAVMNERLSGEATTTVSFESAVHTNTQENDPVITDEDKKDDRRKSTAANPKTRGDIKSGKKILQKAFHSKKAPKSAKKDISAKKELGSHNLDSTNVSKEDISTDNTKQNVVADHHHGALLEQEKLDIKYPCGIQYLDLSSNGNLIGDEAGKILVESIKINRWVISLDLRGCSIGDFFADTINGVLVNNQKNLIK